MSDHPRRLPAMRDSGIVVVVHGTKKFRDRVRGAMATPTDASTTALGDWYVTALFWRLQVALFVNEATLLPVLMRLAPAGTVMARFPEAVATVLGAHGVSSSFVDRELREMAEHRLATTRNRGVVGIMNEFGYLGSAWRDSTGFDDLVALSLRLARTPCGPLYGRNVSPDRELGAFVGQRGG